jgi:hypothetical protein
MAMISTLNISMIGISGKDETATQQANISLNTNQNAGYYSKCKVNRDDIRLILTIANDARRYRRNLTRPWGQGDTRLLPSTEVLDYTSNMSKFQFRFEQEVVEIQRNWPSIMHEQKVRLGPLFDPDEYPAQHEVPNCFGFRQELLPVPEGSHFVLDLEKRVLDQLRERLDTENKKRMQDSMKEMWQRLYEPVANMAYICGEDKSVHKSLVANVENAIAILKRLNITNDQDFADMIELAELRLVGWTTNQIRKNKDLKAKLGEEAKDISAKLEVIMGGSS